MNNELPLISEEQYVYYLLTVWGFEDRIHDLVKMQKIDMTCLKYMQNDDLNILFPCSNLTGRIKFRQTLWQWRVDNKVGIFFTPAGIFFMSFFMSNDFENIFFSFFNIFFKIFFFADRFFNCI